MYTHHIMYTYVNCPGNIDMLCPMQHWNPKKRTTRTYMHVGDYRKLGRASVIDSHLTSSCSFNL